MHRILLIQIAAFQFSSGSIVAQSTIKLVDGGFIFSKADFESCHASTICELPKNRIMAAWFGGKHEGNEDVAVWYSIFNENKWTRPVELANGKHADGKRYPCWNPVLFRTRNGLLFLHYKVGPSPREWWAETKISTDQGRTWSNAKKLPDGFLGPIKNKPVQLASGEILYPSSVETMDGRWTIHIEKSDSLGNNWKKIQIDCGNFQIIQPSILQHGNGRLQLLCRSREGVIVESWSSDNGQNWTKAQATGLPNPNSGIDGVTLMNGKHLLVYNPLKTGRSKLVLAESVDGKTWKEIGVFENTDQREYSYPAIIQSMDGSVHVTYTFERRKIKYVRFK